MIDDVMKNAKICAYFAQEKAEEALVIGKKVAGKVVVVSEALVGITAEMCREVGGLRSIAGAVSATVKGLDLFGYPMNAYQSTVRVCDSVNKGFGGIHVIQRLNEFATGKAYSTAFYLASRVAFLVKDIINFAKFLEDLAIVSAGCAKAHFATFSKWSGISVTPESVAPTFEYVGWALDAANNLAEFQIDWNRRGWKSVTLDRGFSLALDVTKLTSITLASSDVRWQKILRCAALIGTSLVHIGRATNRYFNPPRLPQASSNRNPVVNIPAIVQVPVRDLPLDVAERVVNQSDAVAAAVAERQGLVPPPECELSSNAGSHL